MKICFRKLNELAKPHKEITAAPLRLNKFSLRLYGKFFLRVFAVHLNNAILFGNNTLISKTLNARGSHEIHSHTHLSNFCRMAWIKFAWFCGYAPVTLA